jgi:hypothetical protein
MITVSEDGRVDGLNHVFSIDGGLFDQFSQQPQAFVIFLKKYWKMGIKLILHFLCCSVSRSNPVFIAEQFMQDPQLVEGNIRNSIAFTLFETIARD